MEKNAPFQPHRRYDFTLEACFPELDAAEREHLRLAVKRVRVTADLVEAEVHLFVDDDELGIDIYRRLLDLSCLRGKARMRRDREIVLRLCDPQGNDLGRYTFSSIVVSHVEMRLDYGTPPLIEAAAGWSDATIPRGIVSRWLTKLARGIFPNYLVRDLGNTNTTYVVWFEYKTMTAQ